MTDFFIITSYVFATYFLLANIIFFLLLLSSFFSVRKIVRSSPMINSMKDRYDLIAPPVSLIAPAFNEAKTIVDSVQSFLTLDYPNFEILIVNDGSTDDSFERLANAYELVSSDRFYDSRLSDTHVRGIFQSAKHPNLFVINKENGGKADAINVAIGFAKYDLFCAVDSDSILEPDCLLRVAIPFIEEPETTIAAGGTVRPVNGSRVEYGRVRDLRLPKKFLPLIQIVEYLRAFLFGRQGWNVWNATLIISGAFGIFRKDVVMEAGGYRRDCIGEDMELVVRLRRHAIENKLPHRIQFVPDPICWAEVPEDLRGLARQRDRWQRGLAQSLFLHKSMLFNPRYGLAGLVAFPYFFFVELFGPIIEIAAYIFLGVGIYLGYLDSSFFFLFLLVDVIFGLFMSFSSVFIEESAFHKYSKVHQVLALFLLSIIEQIGFRQLLSVLRLRGLVRYFLGERQWGQIERSGFKSTD